MRKESLLYWILVLSMLVGILFTVRYIVNHTRIYVNYEVGISPKVINWEMESDSTIRIKEPIYLTKDYYLIPYKDDAFLKEDADLYNELMNDSVNKGSILNISSPYNIWKNPNNDTIHVYKNKKHLKFVFNHDLSR
ncbi:hypothetical protein ACF3NR_07010 [Vaginella massiliensis]|uniref:hypothetical protein n=1 Tax=Vaginella massiliensis TaxID=1816680 RepID=UPI000838CA3D|nr:hypothetical protein [Vaginella massiliensis]